MDKGAANAGDVRMGTFIIGAAFLDTLSLTDSAGLPKSGNVEAKWRRFITAYFGDEYAFLRGAYNSFRSRLLHNYSASGILFTHDEENAHRHCRPDPDGQTWMHRESFVRDVLAALDAFERDVTFDPALRSRVIKHWERYPPMGMVFRELGP